MLYSSKQGLCLIGTDRAAGATRATRTTLMVNADAALAHQLYQRLGFFSTGVRSGMRRDPAILLSELTLDLT